MCVYYFFFLGLEFIFFLGLDSVFFCRNKCFVFVFVRLDFVLFKIGLNM